MSKNKNKTLHDALGIIHKSFKEKVCMCPEECKDYLGACSEQISNAHTLSKAAHLSFIQENNHVMCLEFKEGIIEQKVVSWNKATTFPGFCSSHDTKLFRAIDIGGAIDTEIAFLIAFRTFCMEQYKKNANLKAYNEIIEKGLLSEEQNFDLYSYYLGSMLAVNDSEQNMLKMKNILMTKNYKKMNYIVFLTDKPLPFLWSSIISPAKDLDGNQIQDLINPEIISNFLSFSGIPTSKENGAIIFSWINEDHETPMDKYMDCLNKKSNSYISENLFYMILDSMENIAIRPSWFNNLSLGEKKSIKLSLLPDHAPEKINGIQSGLLEVYKQKIKILSSKTFNVIDKQQL